MIDNYTYCIDLYLWYSTVLFKHPCTRGPNVAGMQDFMNTFIEDPISVKSAFTLFPNPESLLPA